MIVNKHGQPTNGGAPRIQVPGLPLDTRSEAEKLADFDYLVLPDMSLAMVHKATGIQILLRANRTVGIRDGFGTSIQTMPDGTLLLDATRIVLQTDASDGLIHTVRPPKPETMQPPTPPAST
jgi:hypothetical protein